MQISGRVDRCLSDLVLGGPPRLRFVESWRGAPIAQRALLEVPSPFCPSPFGSILHRFWIPFELHFIPLWHGIGSIVHPHHYVARTSWEHYYNILFSCNLLRTPSEHMRIVYY